MAVKKGKKKAVKKDVAKKKAVKAAAMPLLKKGKNVCEFC